MKTRDGIKSGLAWTFSERIIAQGVSTMVSIILARLLTPEHYGIIAIVTVFITLCDAFVSGGLGTALVRMPKVTVQDYSTAFAINLIVSMVLYSILYLCAPMIANFYNMPILVNVVRVMGLRLPIAAISSIQQAYVQRRMAFRKFFFATLSGSLCSAVIGIAFAYRGAGVWALVAQNMSNVSINVVTLYISNRWIPGLKISKASAKEIIGFGSRVLGAQLISTFTTEIRSLVVGKAFGSSELAYYEQGRKYPALIVNNVNNALNKVMLPAYSRTQENISQLKAILRKSISVGIFILAPVLIGFAAVAETFVYVVLTQKWLPCVIFIQISCLSYLTRPLETSCHQALLAVGKADLVFRILLIVDITNIALMLLSVFLCKSLMLTACGMLVATLISVLCFMRAAKTYFTYTYREQVKDLLPTLLISSIMYATAQFVARVVEMNLLGLILQILVGAVVYIAGAWLCKLDGFAYLVRTIRNRCKSDK